jgi:hypothetical protein
VRMSALFAEELSRSRYPYSSAGPPSALAQLQEGLD